MPNIFFKLLNIIPYYTVGAISNFNNYSKNV